MYTKAIRAKMKEKESTPQVKCSIMEYIFITFKSTANKRNKKTSKDGCKRGSVHGVVGPRRRGTCIRINEGNLR